MSITPYQRRAIYYGLGGVGAQLAYGAGRQFVGDVGRLGRSAGGYLYSKGVDQLGNLAGRVYKKHTPAKRMKLKRTKRAKSGGRRLNFGKDRSGPKRSVAAPVLLGKFRRPKRARGFDVYNMKGLKLESHKDGGQSGAASIIVGGSPVAASAQLGYVVGAALMKAILYKHYKFSFPSEDTTFIKPYASDSYTADKVEFFNHAWDQSTNKWHSSASYSVVVSGKSLAAMATDFLQNVFLNTAFGNRNSGEHLHAYNLKDALGNVLANCFLQECYIRCYCFMNVDVQNVTQSDGAVDSTSVVDTNPLKGSMYHVRSRIPVLSNEDKAVLSADLVPADDGLILAGVPHGDEFSAPLNACDYHHCSGVGTVTLRPGGVKRLSVPFKFDGRIKDLLIGCNPSGFPNVKVGFGVSRFLHLEKAMNTGSTVNVSINYNLETFAGAYVKKISGQPTRKVVVGA